MKSQIGRSMIEMLGVLAIIGVLSIGGLAGYTRAMTTYQGQKIMDYYNRCAVAGIEKYHINGTEDGECSGEDGLLSDEVWPYSADDIEVRYFVQPEEGKIGISTMGSDFCEQEDKYSNICKFFTDKALQGTVNGVTWIQDSGGTGATYKM